MITVTPHAIARFQERVAPCSVETARERILAASHAIGVAAKFGCEVVRLGNGARLILEGEKVVTVYAAHTLPRQCRRSSHSGGSYAAA